MRHARTQSVANNSNTSENASVMSENPDLPAGSAEPHVGEPKRLESQIDASDVCRGLQRIRESLKKN